VSTVEQEERGLLVIVGEDATEEEWHDGRDEGVTASEIHDIAVGSRKAHRTILDGKLNGSTFKGNAATQAGHDAEAGMIAAVRELPGVVSAQESRSLFGNWDNPLHRATPDGFGMSGQLGQPFGIEAKWHAAGWAGAVWAGDWDQSVIPAEHFDQMQWGMHVTGLEWWLYVVTVEGIDGIKHVWVPRNDRRIAALVREAEAFIAWRECGAPEVDDLPDEVDDALAEYARALADAADADARKKLARLVIDAYAAENLPDDGPLRKSGSRASLFVQAKPPTPVLDELAWREAEPATYEEYVSTIARAEAQRCAAAELYTTTKPVAPVFRVNPNGDPK
jgi:hypothetical protein